MDCHRNIWWTSSAVGPSHSMTVWCTFCHSLYTLRRDLPSQFRIKRKWCKSLSFEIERYNKPIYLQVQSCNITAYLNQITEALPQYQSELHHSPPKLHCRKTKMKYCSMKFPLTRLISKQVSQDESWLRKEMHQAHNRKWTGSSYLRQPSIALNQWSGNRV